MFLWIASVSRNALTHCLMVRGIAQRIGTADLPLARIIARLGLKITVPPIGAVFVPFTFGLLTANAFAPAGQPVAVLDWTDTATTLVDDEPSLQRTNAPARLVHLESILFATRLTVVVQRESVPWRANTFPVRVTHEPTVCRT